MYGGEILCDRPLPEAVIIRSLEEAFECSPEAIQLSNLAQTPPEHQKIYWASSNVDGEYKLKLHLQYFDAASPFIDRVTRFCYVANCQVLIEDDRPTPHTRILIQPQHEHLHVTLDKQKFADSAFTIDQNGLMLYGSFAVDLWLGNVAIRSGLSQVLPFEWHDISLRNVDGYAARHASVTPIMVDVEASDDFDFPLQIDVWSRSGVRWNPHGLAMQDWLAAIERFCAIHQCTARTLGPDGPHIIGAHS